MQPTTPIQDLVEYLEDFLGEETDFEKKALAWHAHYGVGMRTARETRGFSMRHVAESSGISAATVQRLEKGYSKWTVEYARKYLDVLK